MVYDNHPGTKKNWEKTSHPKKKQRITCKNKGLDVWVLKKKVDSHEPRKKPSYFPLNPG